QIAGVEEDLINKPDRPIPSQKITVFEAKLRWALALTAFISLAVYKPTLRPETICWILTVALTCATPLGKHWFVKKLYLRDMKGDAAIGRRTLPLVFGSSGSRWIITFFLIPASLLVLW
ncbi:hypothetical protein BDP27DRAFT_1181106, partial [Rhodocollybia butyracea]